MAAEPPAQAPVWGAVGAAAPAGDALARSEVVHVTVNGTSQQFTKGGATRHGIHGMCNDLPSEAHPSVPHEGITALLGCQSKFLWLRAALDGPVEGQPPRCPASPRVRRNYGARCCC